MRFCQNQKGRGSWSNEPDQVLRKNQGGNLIQKYYRLNQYITAASLRVLDDKGKQVGLFSRLEAFRKAQEAGLDLVEIAPHANPPVAKIIDFKKFKYLEAKKQKENKKKAQEVEVKQIRVRPFIADNDFEIRATRAEKFLESGNRLKIVVKFQGREFSRKEFGYNIIKRFAKRLENVSQSQGEARWEGRVLTAFLLPKRKDYAKNENKESGR